MLIIYIEKEKNSNQDEITSFERGNGTLLLEFLGVSVVHYSVKIRVLHIIMWALEIMGLKTFNFHAYLTGNIGSIITNLGQILSLLAVSGNTL